MPGRSTACEGLGAVYGVQGRLEKSTGTDGWAKELAFSPIQDQGQTGSICALKNEILESREGWLNKAWAGPKGEKGVDCFVGRTWEAAALE